MMKTYIEFFTIVNEDLPTNNAGGGKIDGIGVGVNSEPGVKKSQFKVLNRKNKEKDGVRINSPGQRRDH